MAGNRKAQDWLEAHVAHPDKDECLIWPFYRNNKGYATIVGGYPATREMCRRAHGEPPTPEHESAHSCGNGKDGCINPHHLRWATHAENMADKPIHGTSNRGEKSPNAKLTEQAVRDIRSGGDVADHAVRYGISEKYVKAIRRGENWGWLK